MGVNLDCLGMLMYVPKLKQDSKNGNKDAKDIIDRMKDVKKN